MWDTVPTPDERHAHLSHDLPCQRCGHAMHVYLACDAACGCTPVSAPVTARARVA